MSVRNRYLNDDAGMIDDDQGNGRRMRRMKRRENEKRKWHRNDFEDQVRQEMEDDEDEFGGYLTPGGRYGQQDM